MKNQYVGDIGDYGKYSLLRFLSLHGIRIGINWYLTENDHSSDGRFTDYLSKESERVFDPIVYDALQSIVSRACCKMHVYPRQSPGYPVGEGLAPPGGTDF